MNIEKAMKEWLLDCFNDEYDQEQIESLSYEQLVKSINRYYDGGMKAFLYGYVDRVYEWIKTSSF